MNRNIRIQAYFVLIALLCGCDPLSGNGEELTRPKEAHLDLSDQTLARFDGDLSPVLFRYLAGNPRWEIREERGVRYAIRLERVKECFETTMNGFYNTNEYDVVRQTRVMISFGKEYGFGRECGNITRTKAGEREVSVIIEGEGPGKPGNSSYTIISGGALFLEIYDQAPELTRTFTQKAFREVSVELKDVIMHREAIEKSGILPVPERYPESLPKKNYIEVKDGMQPGIYLVAAAVNPIEPGYAFVKAFNVKTGERLSQERMTQSSVRYLGWSDDGKTLFKYGSRITVYEGDWSSTYEARFELWHRSNNGTEKKLTEKTRMINGWQR